MDKYKQRQEVKAKRASLNDAERRAANHKISQFIINSKIFQRAHKIACYMAIDAEVDLSEVIEVIIKTCHSEPQAKSRKGKIGRDFSVLSQDDASLDSAIKPHDDNNFYFAKHCYLPRVRNDKPGFLDFIEYCAGDDLQPGSFKIPEPAVDVQKIIVPDDLDLVLTPLVAFDSCGNRLGFGGGYYDRTFAHTNHPLLIGVAFACQEVSQIEVCSHDVKLHGVVTEEDFKIF